MVTLEIITAEEITLEDLIEVLSRMETDLNLILIFQIMKIFKENLRKK